MIKRFFSKLPTEFYGASLEAFPETVSHVLFKPLDPTDIEIKPDGQIYLPEIKYRRILLRAFGPGGWAMIPRGEHIVNNKSISRDYALFCHGRFVAQARGEQDYYSEDQLPTATEGCKSNAIMRCCKDLGIGSELWDPNFIRDFKSKHAVAVWATQGASSQKKKIWKRKDRTLEYPYKEV